MIFLLLIYKKLLQFCYFFIKLLPAKKQRIVFLSRQTNKPSIDFQYLINDIHARYPQYEINVLCKRMEKDNPKQIFSYLFHPFLQMVLLARASICIIDGYQIAVSVLKHKKELKIIQIWHSLAAIKKSGYASLKTKKEKAIAKIMCMHSNYDFIVIGAAQMKPFFAQTFNCPYKKFWITGTPRVDYLLASKESNKILVQKAYPELKGKKIVLYAPTFRKSNQYRFNELINAFENSEYTLVIKKHPLTKVVILEKYIYKKVATIDFLSSADFVISDYSGTIIEAAVIERPILIFNYDCEEFSKSEGFFINIETEFKSMSFKTAEEIADFVKKGVYDMQFLKRFAKKCVENTNGTCTQTLVDLIMEVNK